MYKARIVVFVLMAALLTGCSAGVQTQQPALTEPSLDLPYEIILDNGGYYLQLEDGVSKENQMEGSFSEIGPIILFGSMDEMVQDIKTGNFTEDELENLSEFPKTKDNLIGICNLSKLYDAYTPEQFPNTRIKWFGYTYSFKFDDNNGRVCTMDCELSNEQKDTIIADFTACTKTPNFTLLSEEQIEDRNATVIICMSGNYEILERKYVYYTLEAGDKEIFVREYYMHSTDLIPTVIDICGTEKGVNFLVCLAGELPERPSVEYLMGFGFREYVETEVA